MILSIIKKYLSNPILILVRLLILKPELIRSDKLFLRLRYYVNFGEWPNFNKPRTFCEKLQWLKLYNRKPEYVKMVDKYEAKKYVANIIGEEYIIPTLAVYDRVEDIEFDALPNQFVLKCTHDSGGIVICKDKTKFDREVAIEKLKKGLSRNFFWQTREWPYKEVKPRIIAETYMSDDGEELKDYKFYCFNGNPQFCQVIKGRWATETIDFFDMNWNHQEFIGLNLSARYSLDPIPKPSQFNGMKKIASKLSKKFPFLRVDLYEINGRIYFGEITFFPKSGMGRFSPSEYNQKLGELLDLSIVYDEK